MSADQVKKSSGVKVPPPIVYLAFFVLGITLDRIAPLPYPATSWARLSGWALALVSLLVALFAVREFRTARTTVRPDRPASSLITTGIFALTRNPLYLSVLLLYCGAGIFFGAWWPIILTPLLIATMDGYVIRKEEQYLLGTFGEAYRDYCKRVRRWL